MGYFLGGPFGRARRNDPIKLTPANPLPQNSEDHCTGDAGLDGYSRLSRADRQTGQRPFTGGTPQYWGPRMTEEQ